MKATSEFDLLVRCCRARFDPAPPRAPAAAGDAIDWRRFVRLARFHRLQAIAWDSLSKSGEVLPPEAANALSGDALAIGAENLRAAIMARDLLADARAHGIDLLFLKGLTSGALAYGSALLKKSSDTDILVLREAIEPAAALLRAHGFAPVVPGPATNLRRWHLSEKESLWRNPDGALIDLHGRLADNPALLPALGMNSPRQDVEVAPGIVLPTLERDELVAYLCVHGASSAWFRLKWAAELAAILYPWSDLGAVYARCRGLGAGRAAAQALLLIASIFAIPDTDGALEALTSDRRTRALHLAALRQLAVDGEPREPTASRVGTLRIHATQLLLGDGSSALAEAARQVRSALLHRRSRRAG